MKGAPLWFAGVVIGGWSVGRAFALWPAALPPRLVDAAVAATPSPAEAVASSQLAKAWPSDTPEVRSTSVLPNQRRDGSGPRAANSVAPPVVSQRRRTALVALAAPPVRTEAIGEEAGAPSVPENSVGRMLPIVMGMASPTAKSGAPRLHGDAWLVARPNGGDNLAFGQLGASQAGARLTYAVDSNRHVALSGRVSAPLRGHGPEAAAGVDWQPLPAPLHLLVEMRVPLDGGPALPAAQLISGGAARLPLGFQIEGYAQAGAVRRRGAFADGSARVSHRLIERGRTQLDLGGGAWGAAQRGVARIDVGPTAGLSLPAGPAAVRLGLDYRLRIAGRARPGSGPAVTVGGSF